MPDNMIPNKQRAENKKLKVTSIDKFRYYLSRVDSRQYRGPFGIPFFLPPFFLAVAFIITWLTYCGEINFRLYPALKNEYLKVNVVQQILAENPYADDKNNTYKNVEYSATLSGQDAKCKNDILVIALLKEMQLIKKDYKPRAIKVQNDIDAVYRLVELINSALKNDIDTSNDRDISNGTTRKIIELSTVEVIRKLIYQLFYGQGTVGKDKWTNEYVASRLANMPTGWKKLFPSFSVPNPPDTDKLLKEMFADFSRDCQMKGKNVLKIEQIKEEAKTDPPANTPGLDFTILSDTKSMQLVEDFLGGLIAKTNSSVASSGTCGWFSWACAYYILFLLFLGTLCTVIYDIVPLKRRRFGCFVHYLQYLLLFVSSALGLVILGYVFIFATDDKALTGVVAGLLVVAIAAVKLYSDIWFGIVWRTIVFVGLIAVLIPLPSLITWFFAFLSGYSVGVKQSRMAILFIAGPEQFGMYWITYWVFLCFFARQASRLIFGLKIDEYIEILNGNDAQKFNEEIIEFDNSLANMSESRLMSAIQTKELTIWGYRLLLLQFCQYAVSRIYVNLIRFILHRTAKEEPNGVMVDSLFIKGFRSNWSETIADDIEQVLSFYRRSIPQYNGDTPIPHSASVAEIQLEFDARIADAQSKRNTDAVKIWTFYKNQFLQSGGGSNTLLPYILSREEAIAETDRIIEQARTTNNQSRWLIGWITTALPAIGFIGTVRGISNGLSAADSIVLATNATDMAARISQVAGSLGVAFTTTFIALVLGLVISVINVSQKRAENGLLDSLQAAIQKHLVPLIPLQKVTPQSAAASPDTSSDTETSSPESNNG